MDKAIFISAVGALTARGLLIQQGYTTLANSRVRLASKRGAVIGYQVIYRLAKNSIALTNSGHEFLMAHKASA